MCDLSQHVANMFGNSSPLISAHMRYCWWETRLGKEDEMTHKHTHTHTEDQKTHKNERKPETREKQATADSDSFLDRGLRA